MLATSGPLCPNRRQAAIQHCTAVFHLHKTEAETHTVTRVLSPYSLTQCRTEYKQAEEVHTDPESKRFAAARSSSARRDSRVDTLPAESRFAPSKYVGQTISRVPLGHVLSCPYGFFLFLSVFPSFPLMWNTNYFAPRTGGPVPCPLASPLLICHGREYLCLFFAVVVRVDSALCLPHCSPYVGQAQSLKGREHTETVHIADYWQLLQVPSHLVVAVCLCILSHLRYNLLVIETANGHIFS